MKNRKLFLSIFVILLFSVGIIYYFFNKKTNYSDVVEYSGVIDKVNQEILVVKREKHPLDVDDNKSRKEFSLKSKIDVLKSSNKLKSEDAYKKELSNFEERKKNGELSFQFPSRYKSDKIKKDEIGEYIGYYVIVYYHKNDGEPLQIFIDKDSKETVNSLDMGNEDIFSIKGVVTDKSNNLLVVSSKQMDIMEDEASEKKYNINLENLKKSFILNSAKPEDCSETSVCPMKDSLYIHNLNLNSIKKGDSVLMFYKNTGSELSAEEIYVYR